VSREPDGAGPPADAPPADALPADALLALPPDAVRTGEPDTVELLAAALRADSSDLATYERVFFASLAESLPAGVVDIDRERSMSDRLAGRPGRPTAIRVRLGDETLEIAAGRGGPVARIARDVRGVTISRREVSFNDWSRRLAELLEQLAVENAATRAALARLLGTT